MNVELAVAPHHPAAHSPAARVRVRRRRRGLSLLEVMFSIGIVTIGLLGVIALMPLAGQYLRRARISDSSGSVGNAAMDDFVIRRMHVPANWRVDNGSVTGLPVGALALYPNTAICIDPRYVAATRQNVPGSTAPAANPNTYFPATATPGYPYLPNPVVAPNQARMLRVGLASSDAVQIPTAPLMSLPQANKIFISDHDLNIFRPTLPTDEPQQLFDFNRGPDGNWGVAGFDDNANGLIDDGGEAGTPSSDDVPIARQVEGETSWMATLAPQFDQGAVSVVRDTFTLSIVVFHQRPVEINNWDNNGTPVILSGPSSLNEAVLGITFTGPFTSGGVNGGSVVLSSSSEDTMKSLREGDWLLVGGVVPNPLLPAASQPVVFHWYRIIVLDNDVSGTSPNFARIATLDGPDWPIAAGLVQATLMKGISGVYRKTIRTESTSLFSP